MWALFLLIVISIGVLVNGKYFPDEEKKLLFPNSFILGSIISIPLIYYFTVYISRNLTITLWLFSIFSAVFLLIVFKKFNLSNLKSFSFLVFVIIAVLSFFIFDKSFSFDNKTGEFLIASNLYQDLGGHIPYIRSLSIGNNYPFEVPFYSGGKIPYYFMFDFYSAILEKLGLRIDHSLNLLSSVSFSGLIFYIYFFAKKLFNNYLVGLLSVIFFIFPSNLSFINFLNQKGISLKLPLEIWRNQIYINNAPFDNSLIFNFFNLNTFLNQRHLVIGLSAVLFIFSIVWFKEKKIEMKLIIFLGLLSGLLYLWHAMMLMSLLIMLLGLFIVRKSRDIILLILITAGILLAQMFAIHFSSGNLVSQRLGFLLDDFSILVFIKFWGLNLGISIFLAAIGFLLSDKRKRLLFLVLSLLFIIPNIVTFSSRYDFDNHKFFNLWIIFMNFFSAFAIVKIFKKSFYFKILAILFLFVFIFSGVINNMVVKNDIYTRITDYKNNKLMSYALFNLPANETILTNGEIYDPMSLIGKKTFLGRIHYLWIFGKDPSKRLIDRTFILGGSDVQEIKMKLREYNIKYVVLYKKNFAKNKSLYNLFFYKEFKKIYEDSDGAIFKT